MPTGNESNTIILDTEYWIRLKDYPEDLAQFKDTLSDSDTVYFSYGNYMELIKYDEQDKLSEIIADTVDAYIPDLNYEGGSYRISEDPIALVPKEDLYPRIKRETADFGEEKTLRFLFRAHDWDTSGTMYTELTNNMRDIDGEHGLNGSFAATFPDYIEERDDGQRQIDPQDIGSTEYIRKLLGLHRIRLMKGNENVDEHDLPDMEICAHAIVSDCDMLLIESKWKNVGIIDRVTEELRGDDWLTVLDDFDEFIEALSTR